MAALSENDRADLAMELMREFSRLAIETDLTKFEVRTLVDAADDWLEADKLRYNATIPVGIRSRASTPLKAWALSRAAAKRALRGS